jgi:glycosyltransferase involved in cell wall biosynthesis
MEMPVRCGVSVVIPTRRRAHLLREAIESVRSQTLLPGELVVVSDGACESTAELVQSLAESSPFPISLFISPRRGAAAARNMGIARARFPLVAFLDDDDLWKPGKLAAQVAFLERRSEVGLVACGWEEFGVGAEGKGVRKSERDREVSLAEFCLKNPITTSGVVARKECLEEVGGFDESLLLAQDWDLWLRIAARRRVYRFREALVRYRCHGGNSSLRRLEMRRCESRLLEKAWRELREIGWPARGVLWWRLLWSRRRLARAQRRGRVEADMEEVRRGAR